MPLIVVLALGIADGSRAFYYREVVSNAARQALRVSVSSGQQTTGDHACATAPGGATSASLTAHVPFMPASDDSTMTTISAAVGQESSSTGAATGSAIAASTTTVTVTWHCNGPKAVTNSTNGGITDPTSVASDAVQVTVFYAFHPITPLVSTLFGGSSVTISSKDVGRSEY